MELKKVKALLDNYDFEVLHTSMAGKSEVDIAEILFSIAYDDENLLTYTFTSYVLSKEESASWHYIASFLMTMAFNHLSYGYRTAYYHALKAVELKPSDISLKEYILLFYSIPEKLLPQEMAVAFAQEIQKVKSDNKAANLVLEGYGKI